MINDIKVPMLVWNEEKMSVGVEIIDEQHKKLIDLINNLITSIKNFSQIDDIEFLINEAINYAEYHFKIEEDLYESINIDLELINNHRKMHNGFKEKVLEYKNIFIKNQDVEFEKKVDISDELFKFLISWLKEHIINEDKKLFASKKS